VKREKRAMPMHVLGFGTKCISTSVGKKNKRTIKGVGDVTLGDELASFK
jgi:hypothetical protein